MNLGIPLIPKQDIQFGFTYRLFKKNAQEKLKSDPTFPVKVSHKDCHVLPVGWFNGKEEAKRCEHLFSQNLDQNIEGSYF